MFVRSVDVAHSSWGSEQIISGSRVGCALMETFTHIPAQGRRLQYCNITSKYGLWNNIQSQVFVSQGCACGRMFVQARDERGSHLVQRTLVCGETIRLGTWGPPRSQAPSFSAIGRPCDAGQASLGWRFGPRNKSSGLAPGVQRA